MPHRGSRLDVGVDQQQQSVRQRPLHHHHQPHPPSPASSAPPSTSSPSNKQSNSSSTWLPAHLPCQCLACPPALEAQGIVESSPREEASMRPIHPSFLGP